MIPMFYKSSYHFLSLISQQIFLRNANGIIQLDYSPLKLPPNATGDYCKQFTDEEDNPITTITGLNKGMYCGELFGVTNDEVVMLSYKFLPDDIVEYGLLPP